MGVIDLDLSQIKGIGGASTKGEGRVGGRDRDFMYKILNIRVIINWASRAH